MKYKILLTGRNHVVIDDFFSHLHDSIEPMTTSARWDDIVTHLRYFKPDAFCYCTSNEVKEYISQMISLKSLLQQENIPFIVIGSGEDCAKFERDAAGVADLILRKPLKASAIEERIIAYIDELRQEEERRMEEERQKEERRAAEKKRQEEERRAVEQMRREKERRMEEAQSAASKQADKQKKRYHILIIDDDSNMLRTMKEQLHERYDVATAISGKIALKFLEKRRTDLILLDYEMPVDNGPAVLEQLRNNETTKGIPVLFLTGVSKREKIQQVLALKPQGYLLKPIDKEKLIAAIESTLAREA